MKTLALAEVASRDGLPAPHRFLEIERGGWIEVKAFPADCASGRAAVAQLLRKERAEARRQNLALWGLMRIATQELRRIKARFWTLTAA